MRILGIDPGKDGYVSCIENGTVKLGVPTPTIKISKKGSKQDYDIASMRNILTYYPSLDLVVLEKQRAMIGQGVTSTFSTGRGYGLWEGLIVGLGYRYIIVTPQTWHKQLLRDMPGDDPKAKSILAAKRLFPGVDMRKNDKCRVDHDGKTDSLLLAWFGWLQMKGGNK